MWEFQKTAGKAVYIQIMEYITAYIKEGKLQPGERLPAERKLAAVFQVNRSTMVHALDELVSLGILVRRQGSGTFVNEGKWGLYTEPRTDWRGYLSRNVLAQTHPFMEKMQTVKQQQRCLDLYKGELPSELVPTFDLPLLNWKTIIEEEASQDEHGYLPLRASVAARLTALYDMVLPQEEILITSGGQQALFLILQTLLSAGDSVAVELPSFFYALPLFQASGIRLYGIPMDQEGINLQQLEETILSRKIKMVMVNSNFQNPTGKTMSLQRRKDLVALCRRYLVPIVEDDVFAELSFLPDKTTVPLKSLDRENVLYIGSLSKTLGATTKIGWLSAPAHVLTPIAEARKIMDFSLSIFPQVLANYALTAPDYDRKIQHLKQHIAQRRDGFQQWLQQQAFWQAEPIEGGYYSYLSWQGRKLTKQTSDKMLALGLLAAPNELFGAQTNGLRLNIARLSPEKLPLFAEKMHQLQEILRE